MSVPDHIYVIPPRHEMRVEESTIRLSDRSADHRPDTTDALADGTTDRTDLEMRWASAEGDLHLIKGSFTALRDESGDVKHFIVTGTDMTRHRELEREVIEISDRERQRIGEALHDVISSGLTHVVMRTDTLAHRLTQEGTAVTADDLEGISSEVKEAADQIRSLSHALIPRALRQDHLAAAPRPSRTWPTKRRTSRTSTARSWGTKARRAPKMTTR